MPGQHSVKAYWILPLGNSWLDVTGNQRFVRKSLSVDNMIG
jgi:hypothetical protein